MSIIIAETQVIEAMRFYEKRAGPRARNVLCPQVATLAELLGEMWFEKKKHASIAQTSDLHTLLTDAGVLDAPQALNEKGAVDTVEQEEPEWLGKGTLQCAVVDADGLVLREVSLKARLDIQEQRVHFEGGPAWLVYPKATTGDEQDAALDFDPLHQLDPQTAQAYTHFCYCDDTGKVLDVDPRTQAVQMQDWEALANVAEQMVQAPAPNA